MLKKKQYFFSLLMGIIAFLLFFISAYWIMGLQMPTPETNKTVIAHEKSANTLVEVKEEVPQITIYTKITMQYIDAGRKIVDKISVPAQTLLGVDEESLQKRFKDYEILKFNEKEVILQKELVDERERSTSPQYALGIHNGHVCIVDYRGGNSIIDLELLASDFSSKTYSMLLTEQITLSEGQKEALLRRPSEIQRILQGYDKE